MQSNVISVEHLSKQYDLGVIGTGTISRDLNRWWARVRKQPDPYTRIGQKDAFERIGETILALDDISFTVQQGEALGIIGRNGAGKSTLLKILSRVTAPTSGLVRVKGRIGSLLEVGTGFHPELTGRENIYLNGAILGMKKAEVTRKFDEIVNFSGVEKFIDTPVKRYSSGMYVRLAFAVAAHLDPDILIVDEVLAVGDAEFQKKCLGKMGDVAGEGRTVLFVSHNMAAIKNLCNRCILFELGKIHTQGNPEQIIDDYIGKGENNVIVRKETNYINWCGIKNTSEIGNLAIDDDIVMLLQFRTQEFPLDNVYIDCELYNKRGERVIHTKSKFISKGFRLKPNEDFIIKYEIKRPRLAPGEYSLSLYIYSDFGVILWIDGIKGCIVASKGPAGMSEYLDTIIAAVLPEYSLELMKHKVG